MFNAAIVGMLRRIKDAEEELKGGLEGVQTP